MTRMLCHGLLMAGLIVGAMGCKPAEKPGEAAAPAAKTEAVKAPDKPKAAQPASDALVNIVGYYPGNEEHQYIRDLFAEIEKKYAGKVKCRYVDFNTDEGYKEWSDRGLTCGTIYVNDKKEFEVDKDGQKVAVELRMGVKYGYWSIDDLYSIVDMELNAKGVDTTSTAPASDAAKTGTESAGTPAEKAGGASAR